MSFSGEDLLTVERAVEHHVSETGRLPSTTEIVSEVPFGRKTVDRLLDELVRQERITIAFESPGNPTIFVPRHIYDGMLRREKQPDWIEEYEFEEAKKISEEIRGRREQLNRFHRLERLLYTTGRSLEEAIDEALSLLGYANYQALFDRSDAWDFQFIHDDAIYLAEAKGKKKYARKDDVGQLHQWLQKFVDENPDIDPTRVRGLIIINHFRHHDPQDRWPEKAKRRPISESAERFLQLGRMAFLTTIDLFEVVGPVIREEKSESEARKELIGRLRTNVD